MVSRFSRRQFLKAFVGGSIITGGTALSLGGYDALQADPLLRTSDVSRLGLGGGGVNRLSLLQDVNIPSPPPVDGDLLTFKRSLNAWTNAAAAPSGKILVDSADTMSDFLAKKLTWSNPFSTSDVSLTVIMVGGNEQLQGSLNSLVHLNQLRNTGDTRNWAQDIGTSILIGDSNSAIPLTPKGNKIDNSVDMIPFNFLVIEQLFSDPGLFLNPQGRFYARNDLSPQRLSYFVSTGTVKRIAYQDDPVSEFTGTISLAQLIAHNILSAQHGDTTPASVIRGDVISGQGVTPTWSRLAIGPAGQYLRSNATDLLYSPLLATDLSGRVLIQNTFLSTTVLINADETDVTGTASNATAKTYMLGTNTFGRIIVEAELAVTGVANSAFDITFTLKIDGTNTDDTIELRAPAAGAGTVFDVSGILKGSKVETAAVTVTVSVTVTTGTATWKVRSLRVYGVI